MGVSLLSPFRKRGKKDDITEIIDRIKYVNKNSTFETNGIIV